MTNITLNFEGPFTFRGGKSVFHSPFAASSGIYLWTFRQRDDTHLIHYIGETVSLGKRHREHITQILGLNYGIFDTGKAQEGVCQLLWDGLWRDRTPEGPARQIEAYQTVHDDVICYVDALNIFFAEVEADTRLRRHIEGCIGWNLRNIHPKFKALYPDDNRVGTMPNKNHGELLITSSESIRGLDSKISF
jgi:hypothetical protein